LGIVAEVEFEISFCPMTLPFYNVIGKLKVISTFQAVQTLFGLDDL